MTHPSPVVPVIYTLADRGEVRFRGLRQNGTHEIRLKAPQKVTKTYDLTLPGAPPIAAKYLQMTASGSISLTDGPTTPLSHSQVDGWFSSPVAAGQTNVPLNRFQAGGILYWVAPRKGSIVGIVIWVSAPITNGFTVIRCTLNDNPTTLTTGLTIGPVFNSYNPPKDTYPFVAGDRLGILITTDAFWTMPGYLLCGLEVET